MIDAYVLDHHRDENIKHCVVLIVRNREPELLTGEEGAHSVQHVHQLLVKVSENQLICRAFCRLDPVNLDEPANINKHSIIVK